MGGGAGEGAREPADAPGARGKSERSLLFGEGSEVTTYKRRELASSSFTPKEALDVTHGRSLRSQSSIHLLRIRNQTPSEKAKRTSSEL